MLYKTETISIRYFRDVMYHKTDCQPVGQRLQVKSKNNQKSVEIIETLFMGFNIGTITIMRLTGKFQPMPKFRWESIDGGHRKRALWAYLNDEFMVHGKYFSQLSKQDQDKFLDIEIEFCIYDELDSATKGLIFRTLNKTTDVNFIEMVNSYGDIPIANFIRESVRVVPQIDNACNILFEFTLNGKGDPLYTYLSFDNDRLKQDHAFARIVYRHVEHPKKLLGGSSDLQIREMYESPHLTVDDIPVSKINAHLDFLRKMGQYRKRMFKTGLTQHDFKALSYLYFYLVDTYGTFSVPDALEFFKVFARANTKLMNKKGKYAEIMHKPSGYSVQVMYKKYVAIPRDGDKISTAVSYLVGEMGDIENIIETKDSNRSFTIQEKEAKLAEQNFVCAIDGKPLTWEDSHAAHITAHANGGHTVYSNLAMVRICYNKEMGSINLNDYKAMLEKKAA